MRPDELYLLGLLVVAFDDQLWLRSQVLVDVDNTVELEEEVALLQGVLLVPHLSVLVGLVDIFEGILELVDKTSECVFVEPLLKLLYKRLHILGFRGVVVEFVVEELSVLDQTGIGYCFGSGYDELEGISVPQDDSIQVLEFFLSSDCGSVYNNLGVYFGLYKNFAIDAGNGAMPLVHTKRIDLDFVFRHLVGTDIGLSLLDVVQQHPSQRGVIGYVHEVRILLLVGCGCLSRPSSVLQCFVTVLFHLQLLLSLLLQLLLHIVQHPLVIHHLGHHCLQPLLQLSDFLRILHFNVLHRMSIDNPHLLQLCPQPLYFAQKLFIGLPAFLFYILLGSCLDGCHSLRKS